MSISATSLSQLFNLTDTNKDSALSATELADVADSLPNPSGAGTATLLKGMDANKDGKLSESEFTDGVQLNERVANALLAAQELTSGTALLDMLNGNSSTSGTGMDSLFTSLYGGSADSTSTDSYSALLAQVLAKYNAATADSAAVTTEAAA